MTLHEAIQRVLQAQQPLTAEQIAAEVGNHALYTRGDGDFLPEAQIRWRMRNHPELFEIVPGSSPQLFQLVHNSAVLASGSREKLVFYVKCRPRGVDMWTLAQSYKRVFIGYPPWRLFDEQPATRSEWPRTIQDISSTDFDYAAIRHQSWRPTITANRNLSLRVGPGSIVLVPRPGEGVCHVGRVAGPFNISSEEDYVADALAYKDQRYESDLDLWGDVAQTWPVEGWVTVPFAYLPGWIRYRLLSQNTVGEVRHLSTGFTSVAAETVARTASDTITPARSQASCNASGGCLHVRSTCPKLLGGSTLRRCRRGPGSKLRHRRR